MSEYTHLSAADRTTMMVMLAEGCDQSTIAIRLGRNRGTISRELARNNARLDRDIGERPEAYDAVKAQSRADALAHAPGPRKLARAARSGFPGTPTGGPWRGTTTTGPTSAARWRRWWRASSAGDGRSWPRFRYRRIHSNPHYNELP